MTDELIPHSVILAAQEHDPDAINAILNSYSGLIHYHFFNLFCAHGEKPSWALFQEFRQFVEVKLILAAIGFDASKVQEEDGKNEEAVHN